MQFFQPLYAIVTQETPFLVLTIMASLLLTTACYKCWWVHSLFAIIILLNAYLRIDDHKIIVEFIACSNVGFTLLSRDITNRFSIYQAGLIWFSITGIILALFLTAKEPIELKEIINPIITI